MWFFNRKKPKVAETTTVKVPKALLGRGVVEPVYIIDRHNVVTDAWLVTTPSKKPILFVPYNSDNLSFTSYGVTESDPKFIGDMGCVYHWFRP